MAPIPTEEYTEDDIFDDYVHQGYTRNSVSLNDESDVPRGEVDYLHDNPVSMHAVVGGVKKSVEEIPLMKSGTVIEYDKVIGEPMDVIVGDRLMRLGEIVVVNEHYVIRISEIIWAEDVEEMV